MKPTDLRGYRSKPKVFLDVEIGGDVIGRILVHLDWVNTPFTAENFRAIATHASGAQGQTYKGTRFHRLRPEFMVQGGDYENRDGTGGESVFGPKFNDENLTKRFTHRGQVAMANSGPNTNGSQFFITFDACPHLDGKAVIFGELVDRESFEVLAKMEDVPIRRGTVDLPDDEIIIYECGELASIEGSG